MLLEAERRQLVEAMRGRVLEIERIDVEIGAQERLAEIDDDKVRAFRMRDQMLSVRQHECKRSARKRPRDAADSLLGIAAEIELDLEVRVPVRFGDGLARRLIADIEVEPVAAFGHPVQARRGGGGHDGFGCA